MLLGNRRRRRMQTQMFVSEERPRLWIRLGIGIVILFIIWFLGSRILSFFDFSSTQKTGAVLEVDGNPDGVQVSLQGGDVQRGENMLRVYDGDTIYTSNAGNAILTFFDGTKIRLDQQSQLSIEESNAMTEKPSVLTLDLPKGRVFITTPSKDIFTGAIIRTVKTDTQSIRIPAAASALIGDEVLAVNESSGLGLTSTVELPSGSSKDVIIGEGQVFALTPSARSSIDSGEDPYAYRRTFGEQESTDLFMKESVEKLSAAALPAGAGTGSSVSSSSESDILNILSPENNASVKGATVTVNGTVGKNVSSVQINTTTVLIGSDQSFKQDIVLDKDTVTISITAKDQAGISLATATRTVHRIVTEIPMPSVSKPVGSGGTFTTDQPELTIEGGAPVNTNGIMVNDYALQLFKPGSRTWTYLASSSLGNMKPGENRYEIRALDAAGTKSNPVVITIMFTPDSQTSSVSSSDTSLPSNEGLMPGSLTVTAPGTSPYETMQDDILIEGKTPTITDSVYVNGYKLSLYTPGKDFWNYYAATKYGTLRPGRNTYTVVTRNKEGKILDSLQYVITYTPKTGQ